MHAEVEQVWVREDHVDIAGRPVGDGWQDAAPDGAGVVAQRRADGAEIAGDASLANGRFTARVDLRPLASHPGSDPPDWWDLYLQVGSERLRLGGHLDDIAKKRLAIRYPTRVLGDGPAARAVRPYFTVANELSVAARAVGRASPDGTAPRRSAPARRPATPRGRVIAHRVAVTLLRAALRLRSSRPGEEGKVRILLMSAWGMGGTIRTALNLAGSLAADHDVEVISVVRFRTRPHFAFPPGISVTALDDRRRMRDPHRFRRAVRRALRARRSVLLHPADHASSTQTLWTDLRLVRRLWDVRGGTLIATRPALNLLAAETARRDVVTIGQEHLHLSAHPPPLRRAIRAKYSRLDAVTVLTERDRDEYAEVLGEATRVVRIPNATPPTGGAPATLTRPVVLGAGRLTRQKGFTRLIRAFSAVVADHPDWELRIAGSGPRLRALQRLVVREELYNNVRLLGRVSDMERQMERASIFAMSSRREGFPMVLLEAMSKGLPVVSFDCPTGPRELVRTGENGVLVPNGDVDALAAALRELIEDEELRRRYAAGALATAAEHSLDAVGAEWKALLTALRRSGRTPSA